MEELKVNVKSAEKRFNDDWMQILRNQLNIISTSLYLLENDISNSNILDRHRYLQKIKEAMERINIIVK